MLPRMKHSLGLFVLLLAVLVPLAANADEWNKHWAVGAKPEVRVHAGDAAVSIIGVEGSAIDATLTTRGWRIRSGEVEVTSHQMANFVEINVKVPATYFNIGLREIRLEVRVPREMTGDIHTGDGSIQMKGLRGSVRAETGDGSIHGDNLDGSLDAHSGDGSVHIQGRFDDLRLLTQDGSVELEAEEGSRMRSEWRVQTGDGSVRVKNPRNLAADVDLRTGDGSIHLDGPSLAVSEMKSGHEVHGKMNGGGPMLSVHTGDGSISFSS